MYMTENEKLVMRNEKCVSGGCVGMGIAHPLTTNGRPCSARRAVEDARPYKFYPTLMWFRRGGPLCPPVTKEKDHTRLGVVFCVYSR